MKVAIFGAAGRTGMPLVQQALEEGHEVVALVRTPSKLSIGNQRLTIVQGDVTHLADVERVIQGVDAVLSVLGHVKGSEPDVLTHAIHNIITAMDKYHVGGFCISPRNGVLVSGRYAKTPYLRS